MQFEECTEGDYRIFAGALDAPRGDGYIAALIVRRERGAPSQREAYRDESVACGYRWPSPGEAICYALTRARDMIRNRSGMLTC
ncbi:MAG: hypothetical protein Q8N44_02960 [Rubrivivax sp.]|nr:hypothetical protein [Rubrivivax sp.]MDP3082640.1 hypothetical protein [Rubrivivax sp.]